ncbi:MAG: translation initiation factor IF-2 [Bacteroidetes bacterium]|nr:translation initiation factor IF-2 [Bacteroidota bacterium]
MSEGTTTIRLSKAAREFNIGVSTVVDFLLKRGFTIEKDPNSKLSQEMYTLLMKEFATEKHVKEEAKKIGLHFTQHETITIDNKRLTSKDKEKEQDEPLYIKNAALEYNTKLFDTQKKATEPPVKEIPKEEKKKEEAPVKETPKPQKEAAKTEPPAADVSKEAEEGKPAKAEKKKSGKTTRKKTEEDIAEAVAEAEAVETKEETGKKPDSKASGITIVGKLDLDTVAKKPSRKGKGKKEKTEEPVEEALPVIPDAVAEEPVIETEPVVEAEPEIIDEIQEEAVKVEDNFLPREKISLAGPTILGTMKLPEPRKAVDKKKPVASSSDDTVKGKKKKRKRIKKQMGTPVENDTQAKPDPSKSKPHARKGGYRDTVKPELSEEDIQKQIKETLARLGPVGKSKASKYRRLKREAVSQQLQQDQEKMEEGRKVIQVTEFVTANELATMMNVPVTNIISTCMSLGLFVSINQRLDAETLTLVADEFGYQVEFVSVDVQEAISSHEETDAPEDLTPRPPIATVMGHVDHGKTKLLDYIRKTNVVAGEAGGITQHIGAYEVKLENGKSITFLDTPGHEAFTAMRARGAKVTDIVIIVIAADDNVMPQTREAINHALAAQTPIVFAINKIDKPNANPEKVKEELSKMNILVEDWGGNYQSQEISAKAGTNVNILLDKVMLEAEMLNLRANPNRLAVGTVIESSLDKGRGYVSKLLVQSGTLKLGDMVLAGSTYGKVKAMYNERNQSIREAGPSVPLLMLGLNGAPQAGDIFNVMTDEKEVKTFANKRLQLQREQGIRTQKHITLDEIGRRIAIGDFKELNLIVKADVDGSVEALSDSLLKLSTEEVMVSVIHKSVGAITESDVLLASASNAIIVGFQVRPSLSARKLAEQEQIDIRLYSIIYHAIEEIKAAIEGMLSPEIEEKILCNIEVRDVFRITKVGTVAGCYVLDGRVTRNTRIRVIRDGIVVYTGNLGSLKRFKDDVKEVLSGYECGLNIDNFNDIKVGDIVEGYEEIEIKRRL